MPGLAGATGYVQEAGADERKHSPQCAANGSPPAEGEAGAGAESRLQPAASVGPPARRKRKEAAPGVVGPHSAASKAGMIGLTHFYARRPCARRNHRQYDRSGAHRDRYGDLQPERAARPDPCWPIRVAGGGRRSRRDACRQRVHHRPDRQRERRLVYSGGGGRSIVSANPPSEGGGGIAAA